MNVKLMWFFVHINAFFWLVLGFQILMPELPQMQASVRTFLALGFLNAAILEYYVYRKYMKLKDGT